MSRTYSRSGMVPARIETMDSNTHTPGPWILHADTRSIEAVEPNSGLPLTTICTFPNPSFIWDAYNARLIAAAPETAAKLAAAEAANAALLAALKATLDRYVQLVNCGDCGNWDPEKEQHVVDARSALSRVSGEGSAGTSSLAKVASGDRTVQS